MVIVRDKGVKRKSLLSASSKLNTDAFWNSVAVNSWVLLAAKFTGTRVIGESVSGKIEMRQFFGKVYFIGFL